MTVRAVLLSLPHVSVLPRITPSIQSSRRLLHIQSSKHQPDATSFDHRSIMARSTKEKPTRDDVHLLAKRLNITVKPEFEGDFLAALDGIHTAAEAVMGEPDYVPVVDRQQYPRRKVWLSDDEQDFKAGWAYQTLVERDPPVENGILQDQRVVVKDTIMVADVPALFGSEVGGEFLGHLDATVVTRILDAGGRITGKANCENWAWTYLSCTSPKGPIDNPYAPGFSAGGSSSGCAALIASGKADLAVGGDQTGSLRVPASHCGLVGLKPTYGLVPCTGVIGFEPEKEIIGPMARTVRECAALLEATAGLDNIDLRTTDRRMPEKLPKYTAELDAARSKKGKESLRGVKIGILNEGFNGPGADPEIGRNVKAAIERYRELGAEVIETTCKGYVAAAQSLLVGTQVSAIATLKGQATGTKQLKLGAFFEGFLPWTSEGLDKVRTRRFFHQAFSADAYSFNKCDPSLKMSMVQAEYLTVNFPTAYDRSVNLVRRLSNSIDDLLTTCDVLAMPTVVVRPRRHVPPGSPLSAYTEAGLHMGVNTTPFSATTHPAISIPVGYTAPLDADIKTDSDKEIQLPVGMQLVGQKYGEIDVLKIADAWEQAFGKGTLSDLAA